MSPLYQPGTFPFMCVLSEFYRDEDTCLVPGHFYTAGCYLYRELLYDVVHMFCRHCRFQYVFIFYFIVSKCAPLF